MTAAEINRRILEIVHLEPALVLIALGLGSWLFYLLALRRLTEERHRLFRRDFKSLARSGVIAGVLAGAHQLVLLQFPELSSYSGFLVILWSSIVFLKIARIMANEFFFFNSMRAGVPLLLVNIFTLILSIVIASWILTSVFDVKVTSVLATSAVLTIVLGLALQDTLGNLFAAISFQIDKPFELDDWIEIQTDEATKISGQVRELTWRATVLQAFTDETITIPNRTMAQARILNYSSRTRPFFRSYFFRIALNADVAKAKAALRRAIAGTQGVLTPPEPMVIITEAGDSWICLKAIYAIENYGGQYAIADRFYENALKELRAEGIALAAKRLTVLSSPGESAR